MNEKLSYLALLIEKAHSTMRYNTTPLLKPESLTQHTFDALLIAVYLYKEFSPPVNLERCLLYLIFHDLEEALIGDIPRPVKYFNATTRDAIGHLESIVRDYLVKLNIVVPISLSEEEKVFCKIVDIASVIIKCEREMLLGNRYIAPIYKEALGYLQHYRLYDWADVIINHITAHNPRIDDHAIEEMHDITREPLRALPPQS